LGTSVLQTFEAKKQVVLWFCFLYMFLVSLVLCPKGPALEVALAGGVEDAEGLFLSLGSPCSLPLPLAFPLSYGFVMFFTGGARAKLGLILGEGVEGRGEAGTFFC